MSFRFKQFFVEDSKCAMKVGTDGVLLGAWCPIVNRKSSNRKFLDVGTGCGLIALMLQQRYPQAIIDAIDIDAQAAEQARNNGVNATCAKLQEWQGSYDLIVSNPPYFQNSLKNPDKGRKLARHTDSLRYDELIRHSARLLKDDGQLALILPAEAENDVRQLAAAENLFPTHIMRVYSKESKPVLRVLMAFEKSTTSRRPLVIPVIEDTLVLEDEKGGRSLPYQELCRDFYL